MVTSSREFTARYYLLTSKATDETPSASPTLPIRSRASQTAATATPLLRGRIVKDRLSTNRFVRIIIFPGGEASPRRPGPRPRAGGRLVFIAGQPGRPHVWVRASGGRAPAKNNVFFWGRGVPPPIGPEIHPNRLRKQGTKHERNNLATRSVLTWYSSSQYPN
jgi:hypothetical protein